VVVGQDAQAAVAEPIASAVADVRHDHVSSDERGRHERGPEPAGLPRRRMAAYSVVRGLEGRDQSGTGLGEQLRRSAELLEGRDEGPRRNPTRNLSVAVPAHSVGDDHDPKVRSRDGDVLVALSYPAAVGLGGYVEEQHLAGL